jgi:hypothetical protein
MRVLLLLVLLAATASAGWCNCCLYSTTSPCPTQSTSLSVLPTTLANLDMAGGTVKITVVRDDGSITDPFENTTHATTGYNAFINIVLNRLVKRTYTSYVYSLQHVYETCELSNNNMIVVMFLSVDYVFTNGGPVGLHTQCIAVELVARCDDNTKINMYRHMEFGGSTIVGNGMCTNLNSYPHQSESAYVGGLLAHYVRTPPTDPFDFSSGEWQQQCYAEWTLHTTNIEVNGTTNLVIPQWETDPLKPRVFSSTSDHDKCIPGAYPVVSHDDAPTITPAVHDTADQIVAAIVAAYTGSFPRATASHVKVVSMVDEDEYILDVALQYAAISQRSPRAIIRVVVLAINQSGTLTLYPANTTTFAAYSHLHAADTSHSVFQDRACTYTNVTVPCAPHVETPHSVYGGAWPNITVFSIGNTSSPCPLPAFSPCPVTPTGPCDSNSSYTTDILERATYMVLPVSLPVAAAAVLAIVAVCTGATVVKTVLPTVRRVPMRSGKYMPVPSQDAPPAYTPDAPPAYTPPVTRSQDPPAAYAQDQDVPKRSQPSARQPIRRPPPQQQQYTEEPEYWAAPDDTYGTPPSYRGALKKRMPPRGAPTSPDGWQLEPLLHG